MEKLKVQIKKLRADATIPSYAKEGDAGMDLTATTIESIDDQNDGLLKYGTGIAVKIPEGYVGLIFPRSSIYKKEQFLTNSVGVIDSGYTGEISMILAGNFEYYKVGERIGQLIIMPYPQIEFEEVEELPITERGSGGYGSTGK